MDFGPAPRGTSRNDDGLVGGLIPRRLGDRLPERGVGLVARETCAVDNYTRSDLVGAQVSFYLKAHLSLDGQISHDRPQNRCFATSKVEKRRNARSHCG